MSWDCGGPALIAGIGQALAPLQGAPGENWNLQMVRTGSWRVDLALGAVGWLSATGSRCQEGDAGTPKGGYRDEHEDEHPRATRVGRRRFGGDRGGVAGR